MTPIIGLEAYMRRIHARPAAARGKIDDTGGETEAVKSFITTDVAGEHERGISEPA